MTREPATVPQNNNNNNPVFRFIRETYSIKIQNIADEGTGPSTPIPESAVA